MPSGGARLRSGPPPDPNALRREHDKLEWTRLPASGRVGEPPKWPLAHPTRRELAIWRSEWARPQAIMWERLGQEMLAAVYVRAFVDAEQPKASPVARTLVVRLMGDLGITLAGLKSLRWIIDSDEPPVAPAKPPTAARRAARDRLEVLRGGA